MKPDLSVMNKSLVVALFSCAALGGMAEHAAAKNQSYTVKLEVSIPGDPFEVAPVEAGWIDKAQVLDFDPATRKVKPFEKQMQYKGAAAIQATLTGRLNADGKVEFFGSDPSKKVFIPLDVTFNNIALGKTPVTVVTAQNARAGGRAALKIIQTREVPPLPNGDYLYANVGMLFEPVVAQ